MSSPAATSTSAPRRRGWFFAGVLLLSGFAVFVFRFGSDANTIDGVETATVTRGDFVEWLAFRGEIEARQSSIVVAPSNAGELQIIRLARNGATVARGQVVAEFDATQVRQALAEKRTSLRQAEAEIEKARAQGHMDAEAVLTEKLKGGYDVERAKLDVGAREVVSMYDATKAEIKLSDAQQKLRETTARLTATQAAQHAEMQGLLHKRDKAAADVALAERQLHALTVRAPVSGPFIVQTVWRPPLGEAHYREGDRVWAGAAIAEIPDPTTLDLVARIDESDRGRLAAGQGALATSDALPGVEIAARVVTLSTLSRSDYLTWPPTRHFEVRLQLNNTDSRLRPHLSAAIRVAVDRIPGTLLVPSRALLVANGRPTVYVAGPDGFEPRPVVVTRRGHDQIAVAHGLVAGERVALRDPTKQAETTSAGRILSGS